MPAVTFIKKGSFGGNDYAPGAVITMTDEQAAPLAAKQIISVTNNTQNTNDPQAPHRVAELIPPNLRIVDTLAMSPSTSTVVVGADLDLTVNATFTDDGIPASQDVGAAADVSSSDTTKATAVMYNGKVRVHGVAAGTATITVSYNGKTATRSITVSAS